MIKLITLSLLFTSVVQAAPIIRSATNSLEVKVQDDKVTVELPKTAFSALTKWNPEFVVFSKTDYSKSVLELFKDIGENQLPMAFIEDVDGNGKKDIVLLGSDVRNQYAVVLLQKDKKWTLVKIAEWSFENIKDTVIPAMTSGTAEIKETGIPLYVLPAEGEQGLRLKEKKKVGIQVERYMGDGNVYEITNNKPVLFTL